MTGADGKPANVGTPLCRPVTGAMIGGALVAGWRDFTANWGYGQFYCGVYALCGLVPYRFTV